MAWGNPPAFTNIRPSKPAKLITPEQLAASGSEDGHQAALFCWCALSVGTYPQLKWLYAVPNGDDRHIAVAAKLVGTGTRKGVPDIFLPATSNIRVNYGYHGLYIELKIEKYRKHKNGGCSKEQLEWHEYLRTAGYCVKVCYGWLEARDTLINYLSGAL